MTMQRLVAIDTYHQEAPPIHLMIAAYLGVGRKPKPAIGEPSLFDLVPRADKPFKPV